MKHVLRDNFTASCECSGIGIVDPRIDWSSRLFASADAALKEIARIDEFSPELSSASLEALERQETAALERQTRAIDQLIDLPSQSLADVLVKLETWKAYEAPSVEDFAQFAPAQRMAFEAIEEMRRLIGDTSA